MVRANFPLQSAASCSSTCARRTSTSQVSSSPVCGDPIAYWLRHLYEHAALAVSASPVSSTADAPVHAPVPDAAPSAFPTDAALRHRLTTQERRVRRQARLQEDHHDDCG
eukprot:1484686-Amphidinium_carterae.1